ncbi:MAG: iron-sulfur cluster assembly scaffold protein [Sphingomonadaceae bacterium]|nr:iron-sulfur cluster assembly scaffold protein [Sphingomonadaceae bacterium]
MMDSVLYNRDILRLASSLVSGDRLDSPDATAEARSPVCGSRIQVDVTLADGKIDGLAVRVNACALGQASAAILRENAIGIELTTIADMRDAIKRALKEGEPMPTLWPELALLLPAKDYPSRHAAILLPYDAVLTATAQMKLAS